MNILDNRKETHDTLPMLTAAVYLCMSTAGDCVVSQELTITG